MPIEVYVGKTPELMQLADCCMAVSGSVSLELLYHTKPTVILYWISRWPIFVQRFFRKVKYITLVNLLSTDELYPEGHHALRSGAAGRRSGAVSRVSDLRRQIGADGRPTSSSGSRDPAKRAAQVAQLAELEGPRGPRRGIGPGGGVYPRCACRVRRNAPKSVVATWRSTRRRGFVLVALHAPYAEREEYSTRRISSASVWMR